MSAQETNWIDEVIAEVLPHGLGGGIVPGDLPSVSTLTGRSLDLLRNAAGQSQGRLDDWLFGPHRTMQACMTDAMLLVGMGLMRRQSGRLSGQAKFYITDAGREVLAEAERPVKEQQGTVPIEWFLRDLRQQGQQISGIPDHDLAFRGFLTGQGVNPGRVMLPKQEWETHYQAFREFWGTLTASQRVKAGSARFDSWMASPAEVEQFIRSGILSLQGLSGVPATVEQAQAAPQVVVLVANSGNTYDVAFAGGQFTFTPRDIVYKPEWGPGGPIMLARRPAREAGQMTARQFHDRFVDPATLSYSDVLTWMTANEINPNALQDEDYWYEIFKDFSPEKVPPDPDYAARRPVRESEKPLGPITIGQYIKLVGMPDEAAKSFTRFLTYDPRAGGRVNALAMKSFDEWEKLDLETGDIWGAYTFEARRPVQETSYPQEGRVLDDAVRLLGNARNHLDGVIETGPGALYRPLSDIDINLASAEQLLYVAAHDLKQGGWEEARRPARKLRSTVARRPVAEADYSAEADMLERIVVRDIKNARAKVNSVINSVPGVLYQTLSEADIKMAGAEQALMGHANSLRRPGWESVRPVDEGTYRERRARRLQSSIPTLHDRVKWVLSSTTKPGLTADLVGAALEMSTAEAAEVLAALVQKGEVEELAAGVFRMKATVKRSREVVDLTGVPVGSLIVVATPAGDEIEMIFDGLNPDGTIKTHFMADPVGGTHTVMPGDVLSVYSLAAGRYRSGWARRRPVGEAKYQVGQRGIHEALSDEILFQYEYIRREGRWHMGDKNGVQRRAHELRFYELVVAAEEDYRAVYLSYKQPDEAAYQDWLDRKGLLASRHARRRPVREADQADFAEWRYQRGAGHNPTLVDSFETWVASNPTFGPSYRTRLDGWDSLFEEWQMGSGRTSWEEESRRRPAREQAGIMSLDQWIVSLGGFNWKGTEDRFRAFVTRTSQEAPKTNSEWHKIFSQFESGQDSGALMPSPFGLAARRVRMREARGMVKAGTKSWFVSGEWDVAEFIQDTPVTVEGPDASGWYTTVGDVPGFPPGRRVFLRREHFRTLTASSRAPAREAEQVNFATFVNQSPLSVQEADVFWDWLEFQKGIENVNDTRSLEEWSDLLTEFGESEYGGGFYGSHRLAREVLDEGDEYVSQRSAQAGSPI